MSSPPPVLEFGNATVGSLRDPAELRLREVDWVVRDGEFWAVAGLLQSGKSDLMAMSAGLMQPVRGDCRIFGEELAGGYEPQLLANRLRLGLVFDGGQLLHHLTLRDNVALPLRYHAGNSTLDIEHRVQELIAFTGLERWADRFPGQINRSWQQRFGLARAIALKPELLLLDSPLTGLDPIDSSWWLDTISALAAGHPLVDRRRLTLVVTGDSLRPWVGRATHFALLRRRRFLAVTDRPELREDPDALLKELLRGRGPAS